MPIAVRDLEGKVVFHIDGEVARDGHGYILTGAEAAATPQWTVDRRPFALETSAPGVFAVGDVRSGSVKRVAAGVGEGGMAIASGASHAQTDYTLESMNYLVAGVVGQI